MTLHELIESKGWKAFLSKIEIISSLVLLVGLVIFYINDKTNVLLIIGFVTLAVIYFFYGFRELEPGNFMASTFFKIYGWGLSISSVSVLFTLMKWPVNEYCLIISMIIILISLLLGLKFKNDENKDLIDKFYFIRIVIALFLLGFVYFTKAAMI